MLPSHLPHVLCFYGAKEQRAMGKDAKEAKALRKNTVILSGF